MSSLFLRTLREDPADAEVPSHRLLVRAGYVRRVAPGVYSWLPLGLRVLRAVEQVVREEMDAIGAQEIQFPALLPREPYEATGRWTEYGPNIFRLKDRKGNDYLLGPTHEELFTLVVKGEYSSYKDYPVILYQIQNKYRDEERPRAGILRGREFLMKDSYSFDLSDEGLDESYRLHREAYVKIFDRLGLEYVIVSAMSGAMGGSASEEFLAITETGEDTFVRGPGGYAANVEAVTTPAPPAQPVEGKPEAQVHHTPDTPTIETLVDFLNGADLPGGVSAARSPPPTRSRTCCSRSGSPGRASGSCSASACPATARPTSSGWRRRCTPPRSRSSTQPTSPRTRSWSRATSARERSPRTASATSSTRAWSPARPGSPEPTRPTTTSIDLVAGRDFTPDGTIEAAEVRAGDPSPDGEGVLEAARGIEIGHIFQLGRKFADAFGLDALGSDGKPVRITMGSYGIGVSRLVAAIAEQSHDGSGLIWPRAVAPADVHVVVAGKSEEIVAGAEALAADLDAAGLRVLLDDRKASPGVKFADAELVGVPTIVVVGRGLATGVIEVKDRRSGDRGEVPLDGAVAHLVALVRT